MPVGRQRSRTNRVHDENSRQLRGKRKTRVADNGANPRIQQGNGRNRKVTPPQTQMPQPPETDALRYLNSRSTKSDYLLYFLPVSNPSFLIVPPPPFYRRLSGSPFFTPVSAFRLSPSVLHGHHRFVFIRRKGGLSHLIPSL